ncbi:MAG: bifunctional oligoribonuclease/PAP phosphatase NrnA [Anaerolineae bacterium]|nr:bifunctional oligoribonuclease/PAP phosphatase NrnA [Anaerolineae bacterium]
MQMRLDWDAASDLVHNAASILVLTHVGPDGDAIGSMMGLTHVLRSIGKTVITAVDGGVPDYLAFLPESAATYPALTPDLLNGNIDLVIAVDCGDEARMGQVGQVALQNGSPLINLDHHRTNTLFGQANLVDLTTVAAAEGILDWLDRMGIAVNETAAFCLLTGLVTDTLCFRTDNVTSDTLGKAQRLMASGASLAEIVQRTVSRKSMLGFQLWAQVLPTMQIEDHIVWAAITQEMYRAINYPDWDDAGLVSTLVMAEDAYISVVFKEKPDGTVEIGIRAVPGFDTSEVAVALGGGGHALASGATVDEPLATLVPRVVKMLRKAIAQGDPLVV